MIVPQARLFPRLDRLASSARGPLVSMAPEPQSPATPSAASPSNAALDAATRDRLLALPGVAEGGYRTLEPLAGDLSSRRYLRLGEPRSRDASTTAILAFYPPRDGPGPAGVCRRFLATGRLLAAVGIRVPGVTAHDCDAGWMVLEDLGDEMLHHRLEAAPESLEDWFGTALEIADRVATIDPATLPDGVAPLDRSLLASELEASWQALFDALGEDASGARGAAGGAGDREAGRLARDLLERPGGLGDALEDLLDALAAPTPVTCHRDFMVRNLVPLADATADATATADAGASRPTPSVLAVLDHQDLRPGPPAYDVASLLNDTVFPFPEEEARLLRGWLEGPRAGAEGVDAVSYHRAAAQRTLKAAGTYARFARRGRLTHVERIAPTLGRCRDHLARCPETAALAPEIRRAWAPLVDGRFDWGRHLAPASR